jgi:hypothetical protein
MWSRWRLRRLWSSPLGQPRAARVARPLGARGDATLGGDDHVFVRAQRASQQHLGPAVGLRGVEEVHAVVEGVVDGRDGGVLVERAPVAAELPGAEGDLRHFQAAAAPANETPK